MTAFINPSPSFSSTIQHLHQVVQVLCVPLRSQPLLEVSLQGGVEVVRHFLVQGPLRHLSLEVAVVLVPLLQLDQVLLGRHHSSHILSLLPPFLPLILFLFLGEDEQVELAGRHFVPWVLIDHVSEENLLEHMKVALLHLYPGILQKPA